MKNINKINSRLQKLLNTNEFKTIKEEVGQIRNEDIPALESIRKLTAGLEKSKNKKVDYIG